MTIYGATSDNNVVIMTTLSFQYRTNIIQQLTHKTTKSDIGKTAT